jgi:hypothetical protein
MINCTEELITTEGRKGHRFGRKMPLYAICWDIKIVKFLKIMAKRLRMPEREDSV